MFNRPGATPTPNGFSLLRNSLAFGAAPWITFEADDEDAPGVTPDGTDKSTDKNADTSTDKDTDLDGLTPEQLRAQLRETREALTSANQESAARRHKIREYETAEETRQREAEEAEAARLKEQGLFQEAAEKAEQKLQALQPQLETATAQIARYAELMGAQVDATIAEWPDEVKHLVPTGEDADALSRLERVSELTPLATRLMDKPPAPGNGRGPKRAGPAGADARQLRAEQRQHVQRNF